MQITVRGSAEERYPAERALVRLEVAVDGADRQDVRDRAAALQEPLLAHLGDLRAPLTDAQAKALGAVDVLMVPAGGEGLTPKQAVETAKRLAPRLVVPMAYAAPGMDAPAGLRSVDAFIAASPWAVTQKDQDVVLLGRADLPPSTEIMLLKLPAR